MKFQIIRFVIEIDRKICTYFGRKCLPICRREEYKKMEAIKQKREKKIL